MEMEIIGGGVELHIIVQNIKVERLHEAEMNSSCSALECQQSRLSLSF